MSHKYQLTNHAATIYESQKVNAIFRLLAEATLNEIHISAGDHVLDVACGTGIVTRTIHKKYPHHEFTIGIDLNLSMIALAKSLGQKNSTNWLQTDAARLPFADKSFNVAFCQQGLQFFPDKVKALAEIRRVLKDDGYLVVTIWSAISPFFAALAEALHLHISHDIAEQSLAPFSFRDGEVIRNLAIDAGYTSATLQTLTIQRKIGPASTSIPNEIKGNPIGSVVIEKGDDVMQRIIRDVEKMMQPYQDNDGFSVPQETHLLQAFV